MAVLSRRDGSPGLADGPPLTSNCRSARCSAPAGKLAPLFGLLQPRPFFASVVKEPAPPRPATDHWAADLTEILESKPNPIHKRPISRKERGFLSPEKSFVPDLSSFPLATASRDRIS